GGAGGPGAGRARALDHASLRTDHDLAPPGVPPESESHGLACDLLVELGLDVVLRDEAHVVVTAYGGLGEVVAPGCLDGGDRRPPHPEIALHGAGDPGRGDHLAAEA